MAMNHGDVSGNVSTAASLLPIACCLIAKHPEKRGAATRHGGV